VVVLTLVSDRLSELLDLWDDARGGVLRGESDLVQLAALGPRVPAAVPGPTAGQLMLFEAFFGRHDFVKADSIPCCLSGDWPRWLRQGQKSLGRQTNSASD
jgi:hypothetical protein